MDMKGNVTRPTERRTTTRRALLRLDGLARAETILIPGLAAVALAAALTPSIGLSQEPAPVDDLRQEWGAVQIDGSQQARKTFWQGLDSKQLKKQIEAGAEITLADRRGWTPLHSAARYSRDPEVLAMLLEAGADVNARDKAGDTPLHWAAAENTGTAVINALLQAGAVVNARDRYGWLPIHTAADRNPNPDIIDALLKAGADPDKRAYFVLFRPIFLLKHNANMSDKEKEVALAMLKEPK
jgi:ankyrin repeat protein